jgi:hypothetical protein
MNLNVVKIQDSGKGANRWRRIWNRSCARSNIGNQGSMVGYRIMYWDSDGYLDGVDSDRQHATFFAIRARDEAAAGENLLARKSVALIPEHPARTVSGT